MNTKALYAHYRKLLELEEAADIAFDKLDVERAVLLRAGVAPDNAIPAGFVEARDTRDALFEKRTDLKETLLRLRRPDADQLQINLEIVAKEADIFDGGDYVRLVAAQVRAFARN